MCETTRTIRAVRMREWWLSPRGDTYGVRNAPLGNDSVHVVEYAAFEALRAERDELKETIKELEIMSHEDLSDEVDLREHLRICVEALKDCRVDFVSSDTEVDAAHTTNGLMIAIIDEALRAIGKGGE